VTDFRFIHAADIHLDSPLRGLAGQQGKVAERIRTAARAAFDALVGQAIDDEVSFFVIAGDLYDGDWRDYQTGLFFVGQMGRLAKAGIPAFVLHGNHDAESKITRRLTLPENVQVFSARKPQTFRLDTLGVALHGHSFAQRDITENLSLGYPEPIPGLFNIGVLHTALGGMGGHANYAPCSLSDLLGKGYDYWALGHVHQHAVLNERPYVVFPGNLQGRHIREAGPKGACFVSVEDGAVVDLLHVAVDAVRWAHLTVSVTDCNRLQDVADQLRDAIEGAVGADADGRLLACRLEIQGRSELHSQIVASTEHLLAEARAAALSMGEDAAWVEKIRVSTEPLEDPAQLAAREDALGELLSSLSQAAHDADFLETLLGEIGDFARRLPSEIRAETEDAVLQAAVKGDSDALIKTVGVDLMSRLTGKAT